jgi:acetylornithine/N-succinyldiaminopimelate aminotransferase
MGVKTGSELVGLKPDIITLAKPLAGGLPLSACVIPEKIDALIQSGEHGTTFGGGPVATAVANYMWDSIMNDKFLAKVKRNGSSLTRKLKAIKKEFNSVFSAVKGAGMLRGLAVGKNTPEDYKLFSKIKAEAQKRGLLLLHSGDSVIRIAPPLNINRKVMTEGMEILREAIIAATSAK